MSIEKIIFSTMRKFFSFLTSFTLVVLLIPCQGYSNLFKFVVTADMREYAGSGIYDTSDYFRGVCEAIAKMDAGAFMIVPGDLDPPELVHWTIKNYLGESYLWYPVIGNHESETPNDMAWLRDFNKNGNSLPNIVNIGPAGCEETTYSFDYENVHFAVINEYYDGYSDTGTDGDVGDDLYNWLASDLAATTKPHSFVIGHEPAFPQPDADNGRERHFGDCLNEYPVNRDRFWNLLRDQGVVAYICGHTHNYSAVNIDGVWQIDVGHARGKADTGAPSTYLAVQVAGDKLWDITFTAYRDDHNGSYDYNDIVHSWQASPSEDLADSIAYQFQTVVLKPAYPNPFNQETKINYIVIKETAVNLSIINLMGETVKQLFNEQLQPANHYYINWDGTNNSGDELPGGVYFAVIKTDRGVQCQKMLLLR